ncbi:DUF2771 family protein [Actinopolyspora mortivallis]|uniref:DUF2771 domain-containing protein n=1 Tax=Actinopolyspora mortivallis TaxID=33906 RepID=A0A2T0GV29_ACTMO|nr:DUF2771 family protein [Actinopolyspora mortivallis]PRW62962.1 DUF2771 domain-containing protein [Actinopolyspora mortivallis]
MRRGLTALLALTALAVTGCSAADHDPRVTFYAHGESVRVDPVTYCDPVERECSEPRPDAAGSLTVPPGEPVQISVPEQVRRAPWQVVFRYRTPSGEEAKGRTGLIEHGTRFSYTLDLPEPQAQLEQVEVQRYATLSMDDSQGLQFVIGGSWVIDVEQPDPAASRS